MRKKMFAFTVALVLVLITVTPAGAITGGQPDGNGHPYGALILVPGYSFCSGTLIDENVVLTAGHCTSMFDEIAWDKINWDAMGVDDPGVWVTFDPEASVDLYWWTITGGTWYKAESWATHPGYVEDNWPFTADYGVVILEEDVVGITPASLPTVGLVDQLIGTTGQTQERFLDVGYGQDGVLHLQPPYSPPYYGNFEFIRKASVQRYNPSIGAVGTLDPMWLTLGNVPSKNHGSGCGGDSGSGIYAASLDDTLVAVHTGGYHMGYDGNLCGRITSLNHRLDLPIVLDWLAGFLDD